MITYSDIFRAWEAWHQTMEQPEWNDLWIMCASRMGALVKHRSKKLTAPLPEGDIDDLITDSTCRVMRILQSATDASEGFISKTFHFSNMSSFRDYNRHMRRAQRMAGAVKIINIMWRFSEKLDTKAELL